MASMRVVGGFALVLMGAAASSALAADAVDAPNVKPQAVRKQEKDLLPPKDALEMKDSDVAPDQFQPKGVDLGSFLLFPKAEVDLIRNSNIFSTNYDNKYDTIEVVRPELALKSRFSRHSLDGTASLERKNYVHYAKESVTNGFANVNGQYDLSGQDTLNSNIAYTHDHEDRGSPDAVNGLHPTEYHYLTFGGSGTFHTGRLSSTLGVLAVKRDWEDTQTANGISPSHFRNRKEYEVKLREGYEIIDGYSALVEGSYNQRRYDHDSDQFGYKRDSSGVRLGTGIGLSLSELIRGDFLAGFMRQEYEDARLRDVSGYYIKAAFNWMPSKLTTVIPTLERSVEETTAIRVSALLHTAASVTVRHELQRNIILGSTLGYARDEQEGGGQTSSIYNGVLRGTYLFNERLYAVAELAQKHKVANVEGVGFNQTTAMFRLGVQY